MKIAAMNSHAYIPVIVAVFLLPSGCGEKEDYRARYLDLRERHNREIASLKSQQEQQAKEWRRQIGAYEERLGALRDKLAGE
ncbi:MAG: hypothetical protein NTV79_08980 [Candidatus Aureabacteria bacterium]|nr:hypothetical protein [Candidatus Auribacterota bacterium]